MTNSKKIISAILSLMVTAAIPVSVSAAEVSENLKSPTETAYSDGIGKSINFTYISDVGAGFILTDDGKGECTGSYTLYNDMHAVLYTSLMRSRDGTHWSTVGTNHWSTSYDVWCSPFFTNTTKDKLTSGYYYCTYSQVTVYDNNGKVLETGSCFSSGTYV